MKFPKMRKKYHDNNPQHRKYAFKFEVGKGLRYGIILGLTLGVFLINLALPSEYMGSMLYILPILFTFSSRNPLNIFSTAFFAGALVLFHRFMTPPPEALKSVSLVNTFFTLFVFALTASIMFLYKNSRYLGRRHLFQQQTLVRLGREAVKGNDFDKLLDWTHRTLTEHFESKYFKVLRYFPLENKMVLISGQGWEKEIAAGWSESTADPQTFSAYTLRQNQPVIVKNMEKEKRFRQPELLTQHGIKSCINVLIPGETEPYGILEIDAQNKNCFHKDDIYFMQSIARLLGDALDRFALLQKLREQTVGLGRLNEELDSFVAIAAHDLKQPLASIRLLTELMQDSINEPSDVQTMTSYLERVTQTSARAVKLVEDLLIFAKCDRVAFRFKPLNLDELVQGVLENLQIHFDFGQALWEIAPLPSVIGDEQQLAQVFENIISNGLKYARPGIKPQISIYAQNVDADRIKICIQDNGIGMDQEQMNQLFKPFKRAVPDSSEIPGTGLGLVICKKIISRHSGTIQVVSTPGEGSIFSFTLKKASDSEEPHLQMEPETKSEGIF